jgi:hypothetical protein
MQINNALGKYQLIGLNFSQASLAAAQSAVALYNQEVDATVLDVIGYTMPFAGEVIGVSANLSAAGTAGSVTIVPTIATTVTTDPSASITTLVVANDTCKRGTNPFAAGAVIGAKVTTSADWNGTTADLQVIVWVLLNISGI